MNTSADTKEVGELLFARGRLTAIQLDQVRKHQEHLQVPQHRAIIDLNLASEEETWRALAETTQIEFVDLPTLPLSKETLRLIPLKFIFHFQILPISGDEDSVTLAFSEPPSPIELGNLRLVLNRRFSVRLATPSAVRNCIRKEFGLGAETIEKLREERAGAQLDGEIVFDVQGNPSDSALEATVSTFVDQILQEALRLGATDIHLEPYPNSIRLRYRVDGILETVPVPDDLRKLHEAIVSRLKIMAGLNISERRLPHDGRIAMKTGTSEYDLRVSIMPAKHGEAVALRILGRQTLFLNLGQLGMEPQQEKLFENLTRLPQGLVLLTGPTGSGKTTTLYAALSQANDDGRKIITFEDPIEYQLDGTVQIQVREQIGLTFANGLRSVLRHDPDVILVGEIRDLETAEMAVRAAQTGHLVFSTLHANDSISAVTRLLEMRIEPYLVTSSLVCSVAQRLARRICRHCFEPDPGLTDPLRQECAEAAGTDPQSVQAWRGRGCEECNGKGCRGRVAIYEMFLLNEEIGSHITRGMKISTLRDAARQHGWRSLRQNGWLKVCNGIIPLSEQEHWTRLSDPALKIAN